MIDVLDFISLIETELNANNTPYPVELATDILPSWQNVEDIPKIYVGYATIDSKDPNKPVEHSLFNTNGEDLVQTFEVQIVSTIEEFHTVWVNMYIALIGKNAIANERYHSGFTYAQGGKMGLNKGRIYHVDLWKIGFPTNTPLST